MTTSHSSHDWDIFANAVAATTSQIPDATSSVAWGAPGGPEFVTTRSTDGRYAVIVDATDFPDAVDPCLPPGHGWFIASDSPAQDSTFALVRDSAEEIAQEVCLMLTEWAQILDPALFLSPGEAGNAGDTMEAGEAGPNNAVENTSEFTGRELENGLELREEFEYLFSQLDIPSFASDVPGAYTVYVAEVTVDLYIQEDAASIQLQAEFRRDLPDAADGLIMANEANTIATFARFHYERERERVLASWHLNQSYYTPRALLQGLFGFASAVSTVASAVPSDAPGTKVRWTEPDADESD